MNQMHVILTIVIVSVLSQIAHAAPGLRSRRADVGFDEIGAVDSSDLNPVELEMVSGGGLDREKRKLPEATFASKNAVIGFVFSNIDRLIDSKTRFIDALDRTNIEKNRQANIVVPQPIPDFQSLISAIIQPKIQAITGKFSSLSGSFLGGSGGSGANGAGAGGNGLSNILGSVLRLSGPILGSSAGGAGASSGGGGAAAAGADAGVDNGSLDPIDSSSESTETPDSKESS